MNKSYKFQGNIQEAMTHLLGRRDCVESLRRDVIDLQAAVLDVFSRTGPVRVPSWKFPDKLSCNLDLVQLLEQYDYTEGETEFNQHSHIVLLELVVDRLMLLLQSFNVYIQMIRGPRVNNSAQTGPSMSIGPVAKNYWNNLVRLSKQERTTSAGSQSSSSASQLNIPQPEKNSSASRNPPEPIKPHHELQASTAGPPQSCSVSVQTVESALMPCSACARVQSSLKDTGEACVSLCRTLGLNSFLQHLLLAVEDTTQLGRLTASDVAQWACEQRRDMGHIGKHISEVNKTVELLKDRLRKAEEETLELRAQIEQEEKRGKREREERRRGQEEWECRLEEAKTRVEEVQQRLNEEQEEQKRGTKALELKISELTGELELQRETQQSLQCERDSLLEEVHSLHLQKLKWREVEEVKREIETELSNTNMQLNKERAKYKSALRQHEQCEDLQTQLEECEEERAELKLTLTNTMQEGDALQEQLTHQRTECQSLSEERDRQCVRLRELEESVHQLKEELKDAFQRERIMVAFPELNPQHTPPQSTGDVLCDMEQQLKANSLRIRVLEQENSSLSNSLAKLRDTVPSRGGKPGYPDFRGPAGGISDTVTELEPWNPSRSFHSSSQSTSPSSILHQQTLCLSLSPNAAETYSRIRQTARMRSAGPQRRRK